MRTRAMATAMVALLLASALVPAAVAQPGTSGSMKVTVRIGTRIEWHPVDGRNVELRSNVPWTVVADTPDGPVATSGPATRGVWTSVQLPDDATGYSVTANR